MSFFKRPKDQISMPLEQAVTRTVQDGDFETAPYNPDEGERGGYSNYSYWGSTFRSFLKRRVALGCFCSPASSPCSPISSRPT